jgi:signal transduction histidine kinase
VKPKILVVEDNFDLALNLKILLENQDYHPVVVNNGLDALEVLNTDSRLPDIVVCDIMMPEMDGYDLFDKFLENPKWVNIPFVFLTAKSNIEEIHYGKRLGVDDYIAKPFKEEELLATIEGKILKNERKKKFMSDLNNNLEVTEEKLFFAENRFQSIFKNSSIAIIIFDSEGYIIDINDATMELLGITDKRFGKSLERNLFELPFMDPLDKSNLKNGETVQVKISLDSGIFLKNGKFISLKKNKNSYIDILVTPILRSGGKTPAGYIAYEYQQIDAFIRKAHEILSEQVMEKTQDIFYEKRQIESIIKNIPDGILVLSQDGQIQLANESFTQYYDLIYNSELPDSIQEIDTTEDTFGEALFDIFFKSEDTRILELSEDLYLQITIKEVSSSDDDEFNKIIIARNVTPFIEIDNLRKQFVSSVSHELRTPITSINLSLENIVKYGGKMTEVEKDSLLRMTKESSNILSQMIEDLLMVSRLDADRIELKKTRFELASLVEHVRDVLDPLSSDKNIEVKFDYESNIKLFGDEKRIKQVFRILVENAIKFSNENSTIQLKGDNSTTGDYSAIHVTDKGCGIREKDLPHIFKRFYRTANVSNIRGTGLGLSIAKDLIERHGGSLNVQSQYKKGSTFTILLPRLGEEKV